MPRASSFTCAIFLARLSAQARSSARLGRFSGVGFFERARSGLGELRAELIHLTAPDAQLLYS